MKAKYVSNQNNERYGIRFFCLGCRTHHVIPTEKDIMPTTWEFNHDLENPTLHPSVNVDPHRRLGIQCHSFVTEGKMIYLGDCQHELAGKTVIIPDIELIEERSRLIEHDFDYRFLYPDIESMKEFIVG